jgi:acyl carrier protein
MEKTYTFEQFKQLVSQELGIDVENIDRNTSFTNDLGIDSLSLVNFIIKIEKEYNIKFNNEKGFMLSNIGEAYNDFINALNERNKEDK